MTRDPGGRRALARRLRVESLRRRFIYRPKGRKPIPHPLALDPFVLRENQTRDLLPLAKAVFRLHLRLPALYRDGFPGIGEACPLEKRALEWLALWPSRRGPGPLVIRLDVGLGPRGPVMYETNATALAGFHYHTQAAAIVKELVLDPSGVRLGDAPDLLDFLRRWLAAAGRSKRVGFVEPRPFGPGDTEMPEVARHLRTLGWETSWGTPSELSRSRGVFALRGRPVERVFRDVCLKDMPSPSSPRLRVFRAMFEAGLTVPGPAAEFDHKAMLELCTSEEFSSLFTAAERRIFRACVPWTRVARARKTSGPDGRAVDLLEFLRRAPSLWLLKPNRDCGGAGIVFGSEKNWDAALERAAREPGRWVVQERRQAPAVSMLIPRGDRIESSPCRAALGVYYGGQGLGFYARVSPGRIVNVAQGGALAAVFFSKK
ncbi:MAG: hypothetical protein HY077_08325 [Elusimicrobia bacterium]|nr:hypothetical protein [Elusimicrobiota bacterium]